MLPTKSSGYKRWLTGVVGFAAEFACKSLILKNLPKSKNEKVKKGESVLHWDIGKVDRTRSDGIG